MTKPLRRSRTVLPQQCRLGPNNIQQVRGPARGFRHLWPAGATVNDPAVHAAISFDYTRGQAPEHKEAPPSPHRIRAVCTPYPNRR